MNLDTNTKVQIGRNALKVPKWQKILALPLIYIPILLSVPFIVFAVVVVRLHLVMTGAKNLKTYIDFTPSWLSHRYVYATQITGGKKKLFRPIAKSLWIFNCKLYCPLSIALVKYLLYLVQIVEVWWCPFKHDKKDTYKGSEIDQSFWHIYPHTRKLLDSEDLENTMWNDEA